MARQSRTRAFTLTEIIVVMGIIALLMSLLLPTISRARATSNRLKCLTNLRQIGQACRLYSQDYNDYTIPSICTPTPAAGVLTDDHSPGRWNYILVGLKYLPYDLDNATVVRTSSFDRTSLFACPDAPDAVAQPIGEGMAPGDGFFPGCPSHFWETGPDAPTYYIPSSYGINGSACMVPTYPIQASCSALRKCSQLPHSSELVLIYDGFVEDPHVTIRAVNFLFRISGRHDNPVPSKSGVSGSTNILFFDGHCDTFPRRDLPNAADELIGEATPDHQPWADHPYPRWRVDQP